MDPRRNRFAPYDTRGGPPSTQNYHAPPMESGGLPPPPMMPPARTDVYNYGNGDNFARPMPSSGGPPPPAAAAATRDGSGGGPMMRPKGAYSSKFPPRYGGPYDQRQRSEHASHNRASPPPPASSGYMGSPASASKRDHSRWDTRRQNDDFGKNLRS